MSSVGELGYKCLGQAHLTGRAEQLDVCEGGFNGLDVIQFRAVGNEIKPSISLDKKSDSLVTPFILTVTTCCKTVCQSCPGKGHDCGYE